MSIYAVNGKAPIAAWIPSLDTAGNGTTTLTDLVGANNGTLTLMDPATDWVADTGAGGVRALDFDGVDDEVRLGSYQPISTTAPFTFSAWVKSEAISGSRYPVIAAFRTNAGRFLFAFSSATQYLGMLFGSHDQTWGRWRNSLVASVWTSTWRHVVYTYDGVSPTTASSFKTYFDGAEVAITTASLFAATSDFSVIGQEPGSGTATRVQGLLDDMRLWSVALDASDASALYAAGNGRGITFGGTIQTRRRRDLGGYGL